MLKIMFRTFNYPLNRKIVARLEQLIFVSFAFLDLIQKVLKTIFSDVKTMPYYSRESVLSKLLFLESGIYSRGIFYKVYILKL